MSAKTAKYRKPDPGDIFFKVASDSVDIGIDEVVGHGARNRSHVVAAGEARGRSRAASMTDRFVEMTHVDRKRVFNPGYSAWAEQQCVSVDESSVRTKPMFRDGRAELVCARDEWIAGVDAGRGAGRALGL